MSFNDLCPTSKGEYSSLVKEIKKEKELDVLVSSYEKFCMSYSCKPDRAEYPYPKRTDVIDENKSVKWNREEIERLRKAYNDRVTELNKYKNLIINTFGGRIARVLAKNNHMSAAESQKIWHYAYLEKHSDGISFIVSYYEELAGLYADLLKIRESDKKLMDKLISKCESAKFADNDETVLSDIHQGVNSGLSMAIHFAKELKGEKHDD